MTEYTPTIGDHITLSLGSNSITGKLKKDRFDDAHWLPWGDDNVEALIAAGARVTVHEAKGPNPVLAAFKASLDEHKSARTDKHEDEAFVASWLESAHFSSITELRDPRLMGLLDHYAGLWAPAQKTGEPVDYTLPGHWVLLSDDELLCQSAINEMLQALDWFERSLTL